MSFFEHPSIIEVSEDHAKAIQTLTEEQAERVLKSYKRVRQQLRDRLEIVPRGTFTRQRASSVLVQIDAALEAMGAGLQNEMEKGAQSVAELGVDHLVSEIQEWDSEFLGAVSEINIDLAESATNTKQLLINNYEASIEAYSADIRARLARGIGDGVIAQISSGEIMQNIGKTLLGEEWRLQRVVRTELMGIYSRGKMNGMSELAESDIPDLYKTIYNPMDNRTDKDSKYVEKRVEAGDSKLIVKIDDFFEYRWDGKVRRYLAPPDRPNDRSILIPYRKAWAR